MFNNTIKFCAFIFPTIIILYLFRLGNESQVFIEEILNIIWWVAVIPILIIFSWDIGGCLLRITKSRTTWKEWWACNEHDIAGRTLFTILVFILIFCLLSLLTKILF